MNIPYDFWMFIGTGIALFFMLAGMGAGFGLMDAIPRWLKVKR